MGSKSLGLGLGPGNNNCLNSKAHVDVHAQVKLISADKDKHINQSVTGDKIKVLFQKNKPNAIGRHYKKDKFESRHGLIRQTESPLTSWVTRLSEKPRKTYCLALRDRTTNESTGAL